MTGRRLPLRARLGLLTALAVALAVAGVAVASWLLTRDQLRNQLDRSLESTATPFTARIGPGNVARASLSDVCRLPTRPDDRALVLTLQVIRSDGGSCTQPGGRPVAVTAADLSVASGERRHTFRDATAADGTRVRVLTRKAGPETAISISRPLGEVNASLVNLAMWLTVVGAIGILAAATAGLLVARAALRPVDRLTQAAEHIARTENLDTVIPVAGKDEIARLGRSFNAMTASLKASRLRQQRLIADAGHELRTPLTSLRTNTDLLLRSEHTGRPIPVEDKDRLLRNVKEQLVELSDLVGDLLVLARPEQPVNEPSQETTALHLVVERAVGRARLRASARIDVDVRPWHVRGDPAALERAVVNLLDNALKFGGDQPRVEVRLRDGELIVRDHGIGIAPEDAPLVFERFWRAPAARGLPGSGLGLAIALRTVTEAGGTISLEPAHGGGTVARLHIPGTA